MKKTTLLLSVLFLASFAYSQEETIRKDKFYTMSGIGFAFPTGETKDYLSPKFSSTLGANIGLGKGGLFLYPKINLFTYEFNQLLTDTGNPYLVKEGRATTYLLNLTLGYRTSSDKFSFYGFAGGGGGLVVTQRGFVTPLNGQVRLDNESESMATIEAGGGIEYLLGTFILFTEASYLHGFKDIQNRSFNSVPVSIGFKTDLSKAFRKKP